MIKDVKATTELYKHMTISNNLYKTLVNAELWFSTPTSFNDPFDCQINDQTNWSETNIKDYLTQIAQLTGNQSELKALFEIYLKDTESFKKFFKDSFKKILSMKGVACFLPNPDNLLLWAHYSASHTGVCLKFDKTKDDNLFTCTNAVEYSKDYPQFDYLTDRKELVNRVMLTKSIHWKYEDEIRVIKTNFGNHPFKKESLKEIIFGCKADPNEIKTIRQIVADANYPNLKLKQVKLKDYEYDFEIIDI